MGRMQNSDANPMANPILDANEYATTKNKDATGHNRPPNSLLPTSPQNLLKSVPSYLYCFSPRARAC